MKLINKLAILGFVFYLSSVNACSGEEPRRTNKFFDYILTKLALSNLSQNYANDKRRLFESNLTDDVLSLAVSKYEEFFKKEQRNIGIKEKDLLPVKDISGVDESSQFYHDYVITTPTEMIVNRDRFDKFSFGTQRIIAIHEAYHHKFKDNNFNAFGLLVTSGACFASTITQTVLLAYAAKYIPHRGLRMGAYACAPILSFISSSRLFGDVFDYFNKTGFCEYKEFRADQHAYKDAKCSKCVQESIVERAFLVDGEYMTPSECQYYVDKFEQEGLLCEHHAKK